MKLSEIVRACRSLSDIMGVYKDWPLTQFLLMPHSFEWIAYLRRRRERRSRRQGALQAVPAAILQLCKH